MAPTHTPLLFSMPPCPQLPTCNYCFGLAELLVLFLFFIFCLFIILGWPWLTKLYRFQVIPQHMLCTLYCVFTTPSPVPFHHYLSPSTPLCLPTYLPAAITTGLCPRVFTRFLFCSVPPPPYQVPSPTPPPNTQLSACSLSMSLSLFCLWPLDT